ncbi:MAG: LamG-like jellyroll fold domain-containing protein [Myxococcota bacterium]
MACGRSGFEAVRATPDETPDETPDDGCTNIVAALQGAGGALVSAYPFSDSTRPGWDVLESNSMDGQLDGNPAQSTDVPNGAEGYSVLLDGASGVCILSGSTFDAASDHTLCWWAKPLVLQNGMEQFAQPCGYDTWTAGDTTAYQWRINNCNTGVAANLDVPGVYAVGTWVQICQTYEASTRTRRVVIDGDTVNDHTIVDTVPIAITPGGEWCIGSFGIGGGFWNGLIFMPMWLDRVLTDAELGCTLELATEMSRLGYP